MFSSATLGFLAVSEDHWFSCTLVVSQLWEVPRLVPLIYCIHSETLCVSLLAAACSGILGEASGVLLIPCAF